MYITKMGMYVQTTSLKIAAGIGFFTAQPQMRMYVRITSLLLSFLFFFSHSVVSEIPSNQRNTMIDLYGILQNITPQSPFPWNLTADPCSWKGVTCNSINSSITEISLQSFSLSTSDFLPVLCQIDTLQSVDLSNNHLSSIPSGFVADCGKISGLKRLNLSRNRLTGSLPTFDGFPMLESLDLSLNSLSGTIDLQFDGLVALRNLSLGYNHFNGSVPTHLGKSFVLEQLLLSANMFVGKIPVEIANYSNLISIDLSANLLSGSIPDRFKELSNLKLLILSANNLSGRIPHSLSSIQTLSRFAANQNLFSGVIPPGITNFLRNLDLSYNNLNGSIPLDLLSKSNLQSVDLSYNSLVGLIPANLSSSLVRLRLGNNLLNGTIPSSSLGNPLNLTYLELENNRLAGSIPSQLGLCKNLALLNLATNRLTGVLPTQLGDLSNLEELKLQGNNLVGKIPTQITQLQGLSKLNISLNSLTGSIPTLISGLHHLTNLDLRGNNLSGSIPDSIGSLSSLMELQLGKNELSGKIPSMPRNLQIALNLSSNLFEGPIPEILSQLTGLEVLDLSDNKFSGEIPNSLAKMGSLTQIDLANNLLSGLIPAFPSHVSVDTSGNKDFINATKSNPPLTSPYKGETVEVGLFIAVAAGFLAGSIVTVVAVLHGSRLFYPVKGQISTLFHRVKGHWITEKSVHKSRIDFYKVIEVVSKPINILLKSEFCTYYKAVMPCGRSYCIKKLDWSTKAFQLLKHDSFVEELIALCNLSHSNLMIPLAYTLTARSAYLVYENSEYGTLFDLLHSNTERVVTWKERYGLAVGIARGLAFLHGCCSNLTGPIILVHFSTKTIMMKSLSEPLIAEFELSKVIDPLKTMGTISVVAGSVGYIPPEYPYTMRVTPSGNAYSFGIILLELLTGKPAISEGTELAKWVLTRSINHDKWVEILDSKISRTSAAVDNQMLSVLRIALSCIRVLPERRPDAESLLYMLLGVSTVDGNLGQD